MSLGAPRPASPWSTTARRCHPACPIRRTTIDTPALAATADGPIPAAATGSPSGWHRVFVVLAWVLPVTIVVQVALAGLATFGMPELWRWHARFVNVVESTALLMLLVALAGRLSGLRVRSAVLLALIAAQHGLAALGGLAGGLHAVNALVLILLSHELVRRSGRGPQGAGRPEGGATPATDSGTLSRHAAPVSGRPIAQTRAPSERRGARRRGRRAAP